MTNILFDREHINSFLVQGNWDVIDKSTIDCFPDAIILKMNCNKIFLKSHQYLEHPMAFTVIKKIEELTISYHLFGIAQIDQEPAFVLKPDLPFGTDSLIKSIVTNNLIFIHEEIVFYILNLAKKEQECPEYDFTKLEALQDLGDAFNGFDKHKNLLSLGINDFINYVNNLKKFDTLDFNQGSLIKIDPSHKRNNLPYFWDFE
jgi:hypothetical protein